MKKSNIVYILGAGRSGSTLLGIMLGNLKEVFYAGELFAWNKYKGIPKTEKADCKDFWGNILSHFHEECKHFEFDFFNLMESYYSFKNIFKWMNKKLIKSYHESNTELFNKIREQTNSLYIVDSSHYPLRAFWLLKNQSIDLKIIYLMRNPIQVVNAFLKKEVEQPPKHPVASNLYYFIVNFMSCIVYFFSLRTRKLKTSYEDLVYKPQKTISKLAAFLGIENTIKSYDNLKVGYVFEGNRIRNKQKISLNQKKSKLILSPVWRIFTKIFQIPYNLFFRYKLNIFKD